MRRSSSWCGLTATLPGSATARLTTRERSCARSSAARRACPSPLLLVLVDRVHPAQPRQRRAEPVLLLRQEVAALAQDADADHVGRLRPLARRGGIDRRAAARAERLHTRIAALRRG